MCLDFFREIFRKVLGNFDFFCWLVLLSCSYGEVRRKYEYIVFVYWLDVEISWIGVVVFVYYMFGLLG